MDIFFRKAKIDDIESIIPMMADFNAIDQYPFDKAQRIKNLITFLDEPHLGQLWLILKEHVPAGYFVLTFGFSFEYGGRDAFLDEFYIQENFRNFGIGQKALEFLEQTASELGIRALHLEVEQTNVKGNRMYTRQGYRDNNRRLMTKRLRHEQMET